MIRCSVLAIILQTCIISCIDCGWQSRIVLPNCKAMIHCEVVKIDIFIKCLCLHLLFSCCYVKPLWRVVQSVFDITISFESILGVDNNSDCDNIITLVSFLIYKQWLILSLENKSRSNVTTLEYFKDEILTRLRIYDLCKKFSVKEILNIEALIEGLEYDHVRVYYLCALFNKLAIVCAMVPLKKEIKCLCFCFVTSALEHHSVFSFLCIQ